MSLQLNEDEAKTLHTIIQKGPITISRISIERKLSRTTIYKHIQKLEEKSLITQYLSTHKYTAIERSYLIEKIDQALEEAHAKLSETIRGGMEEIPLIEIRTDDDAISDVYEDIAITLPRGGTYFRYTSRQENDKKNQRYNELKKKKDIERLVITSVEKAKKKAHDPNRFIKTVPDGFSFDDEVSLVIYDNKVVHIDHAHGSVVSVTSKNIARFQEKIFKLLWKRL